MSVILEETTTVFSSLGGPCKAVGHDKKRKRGSRVVEQAAHTRGMRKRRKQGDKEDSKDKEEKDDKEEGGERKEWGENDEVEVAADGASSYGEETKKEPVGIALEDNGGQSMRAEEMRKPLLLSVSSKNSTTSSSSTTLTAIDILKDEDEDGSEVKEAKEVKAGEIVKDEGEEKEKDDGKTSAMAGATCVPKFTKRCELHPDIYACRCKLCGGSGICEHETRKDECNLCVPTERMIRSGRWCRSCLSVHLGPERRSKGITICAQCDEHRRLRSEEVVRALLLPQIDFPPSIVDDVVLGGTTCVGSGGGGLRRPDMAWVGRDRVLFVEIDENGGHPSRTRECELGKLWDQTSYVKTKMGERTVVKMIRFNPDEMDKGSEVTLEARVTVLAQRVNAFLAHSNIGAMEWTVPHLEYLFYHSKCRFHIDAARSHRNSVIVSYTT